METRKGSRQVVKGKLYGRFWLGGEERESVPIPAIDPNDDAAVLARCELIADVTARLIDAGRPDRAREFAVLLGKATSKRRLDLVVKGAETVIASGGAIGGGVTVRDFGERWTNGTLAVQFPDHVKKKKTSNDDKKTLELYVYPVVGTMPLRVFQLADAERVMAGVPSRLSSARRRHVAQVLAKLLKYAVYPAKVIAVYPLPPGFLPKLTGGKAKQYLYPDEDRKVMGCRRIPLAERILFGVMAREGFRLSEALALEWSDVDLERGVVRLDENKTNDPRSWVLDDGVRRTLLAWKDRSPKRPFEAVGKTMRAHRFRDALELAGVDRPELFAQTDARRRICVHDLRATFVTVSLANGRTETWVQDRTGHRSTLMIARYRRAARTLAELKLGPLSPLDEVLSWLYEPPRQTGVKPGGGIGHRDVKPEHRNSSDSGPSGTRTRTPSPAVDFKSAKTSPGVAGNGQKRGLGKHGQRGARQFDSGLTRAAVAFDTYVEVGKALHRGVKKALAGDEPGTVAELQKVGELRGWS